MAPRYFPIFQDGGPKNIKNKTFYINRGFLRLRKTFLYIKISFFYRCIFSDFPKSWIEKQKKWIFFITKGFLRLRKPFLWMKTFIHKTVFLSLTNPQVMWMVSFRMFFFVHHLRKRKMFNGENFTSRISAFPLKVQFHLEGFTRDDRSFFGSIIYPWLTT